MKYARLQLWREKQNRIRQHVGEEGYSPDDFLDNYPKHGEDKTKDHRDASD